MLNWYDSFFTLCPNRSLQCLFYRCCYYDKGFIKHGCVLVETLSYLSYGTCSPLTFTGYVLFV